MTPEHQSITKVTVHYCNTLKSEKVFFQPVVCMHVIDSTDGTYVKKQDRSKAGVSFYENQRGDIDYFIPIMSQPCTVQGAKSEILMWEESFLLNESLDHLLKAEINTILFFEVIDLVPMSFTKDKYVRLIENGKQNISWAFLKLLGPNGIINTGSKLRLQLYKPYNQRKHKKSSEIEVFYWWSKKKKTALPASLYVSIEKAESLSVGPALRSLLPFQEEKSSFKKQFSVNKDHDISSKESSEILCSSESDNDIHWRRKDGEICKIPTKLYFSLEIANCCQILKFSSSGRILVASTGTFNQHFLVFYEIPAGKTLHKVLAHVDVIYDLEWSEDSNSLLSSSADYSVKLWNIKSWTLTSCFIHPSFVYSAKFQPLTNHIIVTACYDHVIRIWTASDKTSSLLQELEGHNNSVNALCWHKKDRKLISADSSGKIKVWKIPNFPQNLNSGTSKNYVFEKEYTFGDMQGISIDKMVHDVFRNALYLFCGDATVRLIDFPMGTVLTHFFPLDKSQKSVHGCCSPCGNLLFVCNDNGTISVWNQNSSNSTTTLPNLSHPCGLSCIEYHPFDHMFALSTVEDRSHIYIYRYNESGVQAEGAQSCSSKTNESTDSALSTNFLPKNPAKCQPKYGIEDNMRMLNSKLSTTTVIPKPEKLDIVKVAESYTDSDDYGSGSQVSKDDHPGISSSKRTERRRKLKAMNKQ